MLTGLNVGLATGLAMAYLPDQRAYGPSWQRVIMVDMAGIATGVFASAIELCTRTVGNSRIHCANTEATLNQRTARFALAGAGLGLLTGWLLTMNYDQESQRRPELPMLSFVPWPGAVPVESLAGTAELLPGLLSHGQF